MPVLVVVPDAPMRDRPPGLVEGEAIPARHHVGEQYAAWLAHAAALSHRLSNSVVTQVFEHVHADHRVEAPVYERQRRGTRDVELRVGSLRPVIERPPNGGRCEVDSD